MKNKKIHKFLNEFELYLGTILFICITVLLTIQVISRYVFRHSFTWTEEIGTIMFILLIYFGASAAVIKGKHLRIDLFVNMLGSKKRKLVMVYDNIMSMIFCVYIIFPMRKIISNFTRTNSRTMMLRIPKNAIYSVIPFCLILMTIRLVQDSIRIMGSTDEKLNAIGETIFDGMDDKNDTFRVKNKTSIERDGV